ncbi:MAG: class I SAM-dependent methyltransferase [Bacteroidales bacterium]|nr:class I SAM-dependent methyltransferase [Bacteroidales bacterium]
MKTTLENIVQSICSQNKLHGKKIIKNLKKFDEDYYVRADKFLTKYVALLQSENKTIDYAIDCYLQMIADINYETVQFIQTGAYSSKTFDEVNKRVYNNPEVMKYYVHGILMSQFLWAHHYNILLFFSKIINKYKNKINHYLEVGGGHGLYASEAIEITKNKAKYDLVDISQSSIDIAKMMIANNNVSYTLLNIFDYESALKYDFITMGEVLEHVEDPVKLLKKLFTLLDADGKLFITVPSNAPTIDHIYLFKNADDIRKVISAAGFAIEQEFTIYAEDVPVELAEKHKVSMMYAGVLVKQNK